MTGESFENDVIQHLEMRLCEVGSGQRIATNRRDMKELDE